MSVLAEPVYTCTTVGIFPTLGTGNWPVCPGGYIFPSLAYVCTLTFPVYSTGVGSTPKSVI